MSVHIWNLFLAHQEYKEKNTEFEAEKKYYQTKKTENAREKFDIARSRRALENSLQELKEGSDAAKTAQAELDYCLSLQQQNVEEAALIDMQLTMQSNLLVENKILWQINLRTSGFLIIAALILAVGFSLAVPVSPLFCYMACTFAVAMYMSVDNFTHYKEKSLQYGNIKTRKNATDTEIKIARVEYEAARRDFFITITTHTIMPVFLITAYSICWPAAVLFTVMYAGFELWHSKDKHDKSEDVKQKTRNGLFPPAKEDSEKADLIVRRTLSIQTPD